MPHTDELVLTVPDQDWLERLGPYPDGVRALMREHLERVRAGETDRDLLTPRETEILRLVADAHTNDEIGLLLDISKKTVERHRENILEKLGMRDRVELTRSAVRRGLVAA